MDSIVEDAIDEAETGAEASGDEVSTGETPVTGEMTDEELKEVLTGDDIDTIKAKSDSLSQVLQKISTTIYQQAAQQQQAQNSSDESTKNQKTWKGHPSDSDTVDTDYEVKDDK